MAEVIVALSLAIIALIKKVISLNIEKKERMNISGKLQHHYLFSHIDDLVSRLENEINIKDDGREVLVKTVLEQNFIIFKNNLLELAIKLDECYETCDANKYNSCNKLYNEHIQVINKSHTEFKNFYKNKKQFSKKEIEVLDIFMDGFYEYNKISVNILRDFVFRVCTSKLFTDCKYVTSSIFNSHVSALDKTLLDSERTISALNGSLTGKQINGIIIGEIEKV